MPIKSISAAEAFRNLKANRQSFWPRRGDADNRLDPIYVPSLAPSFKLVPGEPIFTIGSCFARNIEKHLSRLGYKLPVPDYTPLESLGGPADGFMNKFTPHSMLNEIRWALAPEEVLDPACALLPQADGGVIDGQLMSKTVVSQERATERRREITAVFERIRECRVIVVTLGLVEAWFDAKNGLYLNRSLPRFNAEAEPDRFELHVLSYDALLAATRRFIELALSCGRPDARMLLTVSPVPLIATFTGQDVITANTYSKSALRTVAEHMTAAFDAVDYFPSYESVALSDRAAAWRDDLAHVRDEMVALNVARMAEAYAPAPAHAAFARRLLPDPDALAGRTPPS